MASRLAIQFQVANLTDIEVFMKKTSLTGMIINFLKFPSRASLAKRLSRVQFIKALVITYVITMMYLVFILAGTEALSVLIPETSRWIINGLMCIAILLFLGVYYFFILCAIANRLHDFDCSGGWAFILFIPVLNLLFLAGLCIRRGSKGKNKYGEPPSQICVFANAKE
jgi:uncharacterized membrane protein YhaH (DUF805 family)